jgi:hypothetical protein
MGASKPQPKRRDAPEKPERRATTLAEIARYCQQMAWELDPDAPRVH